MTRLRAAASIVVVFTLSGPACTSLVSLGRVVQPLAFAEAEGQPPEIRLLPPALDRPAGAASVRFWLAVDNPNAFGVTLTTLRAMLMVENRRAATADFPLGLALPAGDEAVVPLDLTIAFGAVPDLVDAIRSALRTGAVPYTLDGTVGVDAGPIGGLTFGPLTLVSGELRAAIE